MTGDQSPAEAKDSPLASVSRPALSPTQPPIQWVRVSFPGGYARPGRDDDHSPPLSAEVNNEQEIYSSLPWHQHGVAGQFYFLL
jgi:hypothetical protein